MPIRFGEPTTCCARGLLLAVALAVCGCTKLTYDKRTPLRPATMSSDSVALDLFFVRVPEADKELNDALWQEVDEQQFEVPVRRAWSENGFRVGVVGGRMPPILEKKLQITAVAAPSPDQMQKVDLNDDSPVQRRHLQTHKGQRSEVLASPIHEQISILLPDEGQLVGQRFEKGQGLFALEVFPMGDGRVRLKLTPELHYGDPVQRLAVEQGRVRIEPGRPRRIFTNLTAETVLSPGQVVVLTHVPERSGSLGWAFFHDESRGPKEQKLLALRIAQTQYDDKFAPTDLLPDDAEDKQ